MGKKVDMIGKKFGRWTVKEEAGKAQNGSIKYLCKCKCGNEKIVNGEILRKGNSTSCGCYNRDVITKFGKAVYKERLYRIWNQIKERCRNKNNNSFKNYGGRGIRICDEWEKDYNYFKEWAYKNGYNNKLWIDRIDNNGNYCPDNCRWSTTKEQARNKRTTKKVLYDGKMMCMADASDLSGIPYATLAARIKRGWTGEKLYSPVQLDHSHGEEIKVAMLEYMKNKRKEVV